MKKVDWLKIIKISIWLLLCGLFSRLDRIEKRHFSRYYRPLEYSEHQKGNLNHCGKAHQRFFYRCGHRLCTVYPLGVSSFLLWLFSAAVYLCLLSAEAGNRGFHEHGFSHSLLDSPQLSLHPNHKRISPVCASAWESLLLSIFICRE